MKNICIHKDNKISFMDIPKHYACVSDGKVTVVDERWITIGADPDEPGHGQHVLIKENGDIVAGLGGKFKNLNDLSKSDSKQPVQELKYDKLSEEERKLMNSRIYTERLLDDIENVYDVSYNRVQERKKELSDNQIINLVAGGDETDGSCASVAYAYIGQKHGLDVRDFRGGHSCDCFSSTWPLYAITSTFPDRNGVFEENAKTEMVAGSRLLKNIKEGKEYLLSVGAHTSIVRKENGKLQYLQLQSDIDSGWQYFNDDPKITLEKRFGCSKRPKTIAIGPRKRTVSAIGILVDIDKFKGSKEFRIMLGYINTEPEYEKKGKVGHPK